VSRAIAAGDVVGAEQRVRLLDLGAVFSGGVALLMKETTGLKGGLLGGAVVAGSIRIDGAAQAAGGLKKTGIGKGGMTTWSRTR